MNNAPPQAAVVAAAQAPKNLIKVKDDSEPIGFDAEGDKFKIAASTKCSWADGGTFETRDLRKRIEPWLTALFQSEHLSLLAGSGLTHAVHFLAAGDRAAAMDRITFSCHSQKITDKANLSAKAAGRETANCEDDIRVANELLRGLKILGETADAEKLQSDLSTCLQKLADAVLQSEKTMATADNIKKEEAFNLLVNFLMSFAARNGTRDRLQIFTTNYDRLIECGAELAGLHLLDRFVGQLCPLFRSSRLDLDMHYNPPGIRGEPRYLEGVARLTKLHGSLDWVQAGKDIRRMGLPFGAESVAPYLKAPGLDAATCHELMIYPNDAKDRETSHYPYVELFRDFAAATCRPNSTLVTYGYSFGDEHINRVIEDMLTIPSTHLVIIAFNDQMGRIRATYEKLGRPDQISLLIGPALGDLKTLTENYLPKSAIDRTTMKMSELLRRRFNPGDKDGAHPVHPTTDEGGLA
jgi:hypothetical protein